MKKIVCFAGILLASGVGFAQMDIYDNNKNDKFAFPIDSVRKLNDSMKFVRIFLPNNISMQKDQPCTVFANRRVRGEAENSVIGEGKFKLVVGDHSFFLLKLDKKDRLPQKEDLLYTPFYYGVNFRGRIYNLIRNAMYLKTSSGDSAYTFKKAMYLDEKAENEMIGKLSADIHVVAKAMKKQNDTQDRIVKTGIFKGKKLFDAMEGSTPEQLKSFLDYVIARPILYAGSAWSIAEIFATWMDEGTPAVVK